MQNSIERTLEQLNAIVLGKENTIKLALACIFANGHLLIEDLPGMGKTTLAKALARSLGLDFQRVQFTSDLLPADILGASIFNRDTQQFDFRTGPVFTHILLADEINRASARTQSALLEAMEEGQVTVDGATHPLPAPFMVIATQNPLSSSGTFALPESQLDRFLMKLSLGYPNAAAEREMLSGSYSHSLQRQIHTDLNPTHITALQTQVERITTSTTLVDYVQRILDFTRRSADIPLGLSPRAGLGVIRAAKSWAFLHNREFVVPEDIRAVLSAVIGHRLGANTTSNPKELVDLILRSVDII